MNEDNGVSTGLASAKRRKRPGKTVEITDPKAIRALAHAARLEVISELYSTQLSRTATELAAQTGLTPSAMSYHLRALQKWGIVTAADNEGDARERCWKAAGSDFTIKSGGNAPSPEIAVVELELDAFRRRATAFTRARGERRLRGEAANEAAAMVLSSDLLYLIPTSGRISRPSSKTSSRSYDLEDPPGFPKERYESLRCGQ